MISEIMSQKEILGNYLMNYLTEFDLNVDIVLIVYMLCSKIFFKGWLEKLIKTRDTQGNITKNNK